MKFSPASEGSVEVVEDIALIHSGEDVAFISRGSGQSYFYNFSMRATTRDVGLEGATEVGCLDGEAFLIVHKDNKVAFLPARWDVEGWEVSHPSMQARNVFVDENQRIVVLHDWQGKKLDLLDLATGQSLASLPVREEARYSDIFVDTDSRQLIVVSRQTQPSRTIRVSVLEVSTGTVVSTVSMSAPGNCRVFYNHTRDEVFLSIATEPSGSTRILRRFSLPTLQPGPDSSHAFPGLVGMEFIAGGTQAVLGWQNNLAVLDIASDRVIGSISISGGYVSSLDADENSGWVVFGTNQGEVGRCRLDLLRKAR
jgi:hypothetical protein